jgi:hypothetical protein
VASTQPTDSLLQAVRLELKQASPTPAVPAVGPPADDEREVSTDGDLIEGARGGSAQQPGGAQLLFTDARMAFMLMNHARKRAVIRVFGVSPENVNIVTAIAMLVIADGAHKAVTRLSTSGRPTQSDALLAGGTVRAVVGMVAGAAVDETPGLGTLITIALVGHAARVTAGKSLRALRTSSHRLAVGFHHRYGYLIDPGHWREDRARRREALSRL